MAILGRKGSQNSGLWSLSQKVFAGFTSVLLHMLSASTFRGVRNMGPRGPNFWDILTLEMKQNSEFFNIL